MAAPGRKLNPDVEHNLVRLLKAQPFTVRFFEAVRLLRRLLPGRKPVGYFVPPTSETVRFTSHPSLSFPASEIQSLEWPEGSESQATMMVNFMGLVGLNGALPMPYTELIVERAQRKNNGFRDFLDIFNHRLISFFYRAWEKYHFFVGYERKENDPLTPLLLSFVGLGTKGLLQRQVIQDQSVAYYAGLLGLRPRCESCGLDFSFADSGDGPAVFVMFIAGFIVVGLALMVEFAYQPPFWLHAVLWVPLILVVTLAPLRLLKGLLIALQYHHDAAEGRLDRGGGP